MKPDKGPHIPNEQQMEYNLMTPYIPNKIRIVQLKRRGNAPLGFSIRGGREHGTGVFVSQITSGSEAHHRGLKLGDQIIRINGYPIDHFIHEEVLALLKARPTIVLKVKSVGMIPVKDNKKDPVTWKLVEPEPLSSGSDGTHSLSSGSSLDEPLETKVFISGVGSSSLGCSVVKGPPELPGIFVQTVKPNGLAENAGLEIGDQITEVNGRSFVNIEFADAIAKLKSYKEMALTVRKGTGLDLFPEEKLRRRNMRLSNGHGKGFTGMNGVNGVNGYHYTNGKGSPDSRYSPRGTITNGSASEPSEKSVSLSSSNSSNAMTNGTNGHVNGHMTNGHAKIPNGNSKTHNRNEDAKRIENEERLKLEEERKRLEEKEKKLKEEADKLAEERRKLEAQKSIQNTNVNPGIAQQRQVLAELHNFSEKKKLSRENGETKTVQTSVESKQNGNAGKRVSTQGARNENSASHDILYKQKQHEQLMEEFKEVHKKMFGFNGSDLNLKPVNGCSNGSVGAADVHHKNDENDNSGSHYQRRQRTIDTVSSIPPPPPPPQEEMETSPKLEKIPSIITSHPVMLKPVPSAVTPPPSIPKPDYSTKHNKGPAPPPPPKECKDFPITDSKVHDPKPPKSFFKKPLVVIGTYPDSSRTNRFASSDASKGRDYQNNEIQISGKDDGLQKTDASSAVTVRVTSQPSVPPQQLANERTVMSGGAKLTVSINSKPPSHPSLSTRFSINSSSSSSSSTNDVPDGMIVKTVTVKKEGPLNFNIEGGLNSCYDGRIIISEMWDGGMVPSNSGVQKGDQLLMVNNTRLVNVSLTAARVAIQNALSNENPEMKLTIAKVHH